MSDLILHAETETQIHVSPDGVEAHATWLQKARVDMFRGSRREPATRRSGQRVVLPVITVTVPESLAKEKGLI